MSHGACGGMPAGVDAANAAAAARCAGPGWTARVARAACMALALLAAACGNQPRTPDWLVSAEGARERYVRAYLSGSDRVAAAEFARLRTDLSSTGDPALVARGELVRCAVRVASLQFEPCGGFEPLRAQASAAERAYADFLEGRTMPETAALLPPAYRFLAAAPGVDAARAVRDIEDPVSRLIACAVLLRTGHADPQVLQLAADTASGQGWRRALIAWLGVQAVRAEQSGAVEEARRLRLRMALAAGGREPAVPASGVR